MKLVNELLRLVLLAEIHEDLVPIPVAKRLFGSQTISEFKEKFPEIPVRGGFLGKGDRASARTRRAISAEKLDRAHALVQDIAGIPWLLFVGVTGSVAFGNAEKQDDIDLFIVSEDRRVWLTRLTEQLTYRSKRVRRTYGMTDVSDRICINHYTSINSLDLRPTPGRRFDVAMELAMMRPIIGNALYPEILQKNAWIYEIFPNLYKSAGVTDRSGSDRRGGLAGDGADFLAMILQQGYMKIMRHPWEEVRMSRDTIQFYDLYRWQKREKRLNKLIQRYDL